MFTLLISWPAAGAQSLSFERIDIPTGAGPKQVGVADFNRDGKPDIAVLNGPLSILLGNGNGTFRAAPPTDVGVVPNVMAIGDLNGDGIPDLASFNLNNSQLFIHLGKGDGTFQTPVILNGGVNGLAIGDFNGDGKPDLAATSPDDTIRIYLGNGDGTFKPPYAVPEAAVALPRNVAAVDLDRDGKLDLVTVNMFSDNFSVLMGNGDGTFKAAVNYPLEIGGSPQAMTVGDVNGDGVPDVIVGETSLFRIAVFLGNGDGTFTYNGYFALPRYVYDIAIGDVNGDGKADLVAATNYGAWGTSFATILLGNGNGTFVAAQDFAVDAGAQAVALGDFNGDRTLDIVVAASGSTGVTMLLNTRPVNQGTFTILHSFTTTSSGASSGMLTEVIPGIFFGQSRGGIFALTGAGGFQLVHPFNVSNEGQYPNGTLLEGHTGLLYGVSQSGGPNGWGTLFHSDLHGNAGALFPFPVGSLSPYPVIEASDTNLYGVVAATFPAGFFYKVTPGGTTTILHNFDVTTEGRPVGPVIQGSDGNFYGLATPNDVFIHGIAYKMSSTGVLSPLHSFTDSTQTVTNSLMLASNGNFYGSTQNTGSECRGTIFEMTPSGVLTTLISTTGTAVVCSPTTLMEASNGNLYGVDTSGGFSHGGIFRLTLGGQLTTLHNFATDGSEGTYSQSFGPALVQGSDGKLYGTTGLGGPFGQNGGGTVYSLDIGLPKPLPRIRYFTPSGGSVGTGVLLVGANLLGVNKVSFGGVSATQFASRGSNYAVVIVPTGATTGPITVTTPNGSVVSKASFTVH